MLRVCDPAVGSGAFLVEACRVLADELVAAWAREGVKLHADPVLYARRKIAQCCLYGVDKNAAAVELAKLSLWLVTLAKDRPFTFLDGNIRHGDSLVGLSLEQIRAFHWTPSKQTELFTAAIDDALKEAVAAREKLRELALLENGTSIDPREKELAHHDAEDAMDRVNLIADVCVGAFFAGASDKEREKERARRLDLVQRWLAAGNGKATAIEGELRELQRELRRTQVPFHWHVEFPDVFFDERPDPLEHEQKNGATFMDAFVGNPPFSGKNGISEAGGPAYLPWLQAIHLGAHGNADLSAHFFRRTATLLGQHGALGLIATNTIGQGDTRATGLQHLVANGLRIFDATPNLPWPGDVAVTVSVVHLAKGRATQHATPAFGGVPCTEISTQLSIGAERGDPEKLASNRDCAFVGSYVLGMGFTLTPEERKALVAKDRRNASRIFPYLGGEEVNTNSDQGFDRYVISFGTMSLEQAEAWPDLIKIVREKVKPERDTNKREVRKKYWWRFGEVAPALYEAIAPLSRCLVNSRVTKHLAFAFQPTDRVFSEALYVYPLPHNTAFAVLQSRIHETWARLLSSSMKTDLRYAASDCFETFPFPQPDPRTVIPELEKLGEQLYTARAQYMLDAQLGLTKTYNALKDPACNDARVLTLRKLHEQMDEAVLRAYGWSDLSIPPFRAKTEAHTRAQGAFKSAVIDRLFALNAERVKDEALRGSQEPNERRARGKPEGKGELRATRPQAIDIATPRRRA